MEARTSMQITQPQAVAVLGFLRPVFCPFGIRLLLFLLLLSPFVSVEAKPGSQASCKKIEQQIKQYTRLRRAGGSARQMDNWHRKRHQLKVRYSKLSCRL
tara:strand:+ start:463 stop:762 length:300 start_codon:yes stop_codon:yes gene_type:complete